MRESRRAQAERIAAAGEEGRRLMAAGDYEAASAAFRRALSLDPSLAAEQRLLDESQEMLRQQLQEQQTDHEAHLGARPALVGKAVCQFRVDPVPVDLVRQTHQLVLHVDDLVEPCPE